MIVEYGARHPGDAPIKCLFYNADDEEIGRIAFFKEEIKFHGEYEELPNNLLNALHNKSIWLYEME